ncbi:hypothetical protein [Hymenobacter sp. B81]|uniref:hypothetical protein n=1 Tax=Hymenobacter sp. B81 TaxID=3344878 RepID=UPI0037DCD394
MLLAYAGSSGAGWACTVCRPRVQAAIYQPNYAQNLGLLLVPVALLLALGAGVYFFEDLKRTRQRTHD